MGTHSQPLADLIAASPWARSIVSTGAAPEAPEAFDHFVHAAAVRAARRASAASPESGLVTDSTSQTHVLDTYMQRLKKMRYNVIASANWLHVAATGRGSFRVDCVFVTLTYRQIEDPNPKDISKYLDAARKHCARRGIPCRYVWVGELQQRGALHYHVLFWMPRGYKLPMPDKSGWWPHGWSNIQKSHSPVGYLAKYAGKLKTKAGAAGFAIPKGFRISGVGGLDTEDKQKKRWANLPGWLRDAVTPEHRCKRIIGGGWISRETFEYWPSAWRLGRIVRAGCGALVSLIPALPEGTCYAHHFNTEDRCSAY